MNPSPDPPSLSSRGQGGKACLNCARVKCKCIVRTDGSGCERCHRLNKPCIPSSPAKRRGPKRDDGSRTARLEKKLDDLVSLLKSQHSSVSPGSDAARLVESIDEDVIEQTDTSPTLTDNTSAINPNDVYCDEPSPEEAESCLRLFREEMMPLCPYLYLEPDLSSATLRQQYPFLWMNIMSVSSRSVKTRNSLGKEARSTIVQKIVGEGVRSMDMLLGVLTYLAWVHLYPMDKNFASMTSQIAISLVFDLGLHMSPPEQPFKVGRLIKAKGFGPCQPNAVRRERTDEDRRAVLGAFVTTSMTSHSFRSADGLRWSPYFDECLNHLSSNSTIPQDHDLVAKVKMQLMINQVRYSAWSNGGGEIPVTYIDALRMQLDNMASPSNGMNGFQDNQSLLQLYHFTLLMVHEPVLSKPPSTNNEPDLARFQVYQRCADSIRDWLDMFFSVPLERLAYPPCSTYCQLYYVMGFLYRTSTIKVPGWNPDTVKPMVDLMPTLDRVIQNFEQAKTEAALRSPESGNDDVFWFGIQKCLALKTVWQCEMAGQQVPDGGGGGDGLPPPEEDVMMNPPDGNFSSLFSMDSALFPLMPSIFDDLNWQ